MPELLTPHRRVLAWGRSLFALAVVAVLLVLGLANIAMRAQWHQVEDGVLWQARPEGVTAAEVAASSPAGAAGIVRGDVLIAINGSPIERPSEVVALEYRSVAGTRLSYTIVRLGARQALDIALAPLARSGPVYFVLAAVGLFTLLVGASVRLRRPDDQATLHFFWLGVAFFGVLSFSPSGRYDRLDYFFEWADVVARLVLPPLFFHFALVFPERPHSWIRTRGGRALWPVIYVPAVALGLQRVLVLIGRRCTSSNETSSRRCTSCRMSRWSGTRRVVPPPTRRRLRCRADGRTPSRAGSSTRPAGR